MLAGPALAADMPEYPPIDVPEVDYDIGGSVYLPGRRALDWRWAPAVWKWRTCSTTAGRSPTAPA